ncbi:type II CRISPR RNA-guided endonuclease Cas9 [uncultured Chryseobacterium sp.]|uniref:type II CRISPR RNA-guided endonuclease Cas9 n=1 Tax=uncultured Chryseobacterium sp. TaxID=259322 RepID=UPI0025D9CC2C|nr:type II CRISPR RNA-guided endonuclease Cas9 [uncultured Chryseobacterium sp.]
MTKHILGLDLGTTSIGFAHVIEDDVPEQSQIIQIGARIIQYDNFDKIDKSGKVTESKNPKDDFAAGKGLSPNAGRTLKRGARRMLDRYQLRRENLIDVLLKANIISIDSILAEDGKQTTFETWRLRAKSVSEKIEKEELARVFLAINKKRGYKSSRKAKNEDEGQAIDGMAIAKRLYEENLTPGQLAYNLLKEGKKTIPDFYRSDLQAEFDKVWNVQIPFYPEILTDKLKQNLRNKNKIQTWAICREPMNLVGVKRTTKGFEQKIENYQWRSNALTMQLDLEQLTIVLQEINNNLNNSSGYLGDISDRSKELHFNKETIGQNLYKQLQANPHTRLKSKVFYRQDYLDEFEAIWKEQSKHHPELRDELKSEIRDITIFYQRKLKSQKNSISFCEFESKEMEIEKNGKKVKITIGAKVAPKSSPLFQEFKIWQMLHNLKFINKSTGEIEVFKDEGFTETKRLLFNELNLRGNLPATQVLEILNYNTKEWVLSNYKTVEGNRTNLAFYDAFFKILEQEGFGEIDWEGYKTVKEGSAKTIFNHFQFTKKAELFIEGKIKALDTYNADEIKIFVKNIFQHLAINTEILEFDGELKGKLFEEQKSYQLWHLLYSAEDDNKKYDSEEILLYGYDNIGLKKLLCQKFGFQPSHSKILSTVNFADDYGSLSTKAMRKMYTDIIDNDLTTAKTLSGYKQKEFENANMFELLRKNSLRNPVVEKILNQLANVVNALIEKNSKKDENGKIIKYFKFDEIRIELSRELRKNAKERADMTENVNKGKIENDNIRAIIKKDFPNVPNPTKNDIIKYKLYQEMAFNGYKDLYTDTKIEYHNLFGKDYDIDHIIPQAKLFDDSFSNKVLVPYGANRDKGKMNNATAYDYMSNNPELFDKYVSTVEALYKSDKISKAKYQKLLKKEADLGDGFIERDLRETQYIAKKAKDLLIPLTKTGERHCMVSSSGQITDRLREDWDLVNVMKELNLPKFRVLGLTEMEERKFGKKVEVIKDWTKRNDHRHHAMDALTVAFTKRSFIQYLNNLNARRENKNEGISNKENLKSLETKGYKLSTKDVIAIEKKELKRDDDGKLRFRLPILNFRQAAKEHLEKVLVSHKAKSKVTTINVNKAKNDVVSIVKDNKGKEKTIKGQVVKTPRGQLHDQTIYGWNRWSRIELNKKTTKSELNNIINSEIKQFLISYIKERGSIAKAFSDDALKALKYNGKILKEVEVAIPCYTQKIDVQKTFTDPQKTNSAKEKNLKNILDLGVRSVLENRLKLYDNDFKKAFSDLEKNPIWLNEEKGISIKRVTISGVKIAEFLHYKKDHLGNEILDKNGKKIPVDFVSTGNNHHVAIYRDDKGNLQERVVSLFDAVQLVNAGEPVIDKNYNQGLGWQFLFTMKRNEYFVFPNEKTGFIPKEIDLLDPKNQKIISPNLFRVQKIASKNYFFRHHLETTVEEKKELNGIAYKPQLGLNAIQNIIKVRLNHLGDIVIAGEY